MIPSQHLHEFAAQVRAYEGDELEGVLVDLAGCVDAWSRPSTKLTPEEHVALDWVLAAVSSRGDDLIERLNGTPILWSDRDVVDPAMWSNSLTLQDPRVTWKPARGLWTAPALQSGQSAWIARVNKCGDGMRHRYAIRLRRPAKALVVTIASLEQAGKLATDRDSLTVALEKARSRGVVAVDFSWRCVIEAEVAGFRGDLSPTEFPCGLGTACTLWLSLPVEEDEQTANLTTNP